MTDQILSKIEATVSDIQAITNALVAQSAPAAEPKPEQVPFGLTWRFTDYCYSEISNFIECAPGVPENVLDRYIQFLEDFTARKIKKNTLVDKDVLREFIADLDNRAQIDCRESHWEEPEIVAGGKRFARRYEQLREIHGHWLDAGDGLPEIKIHPAADIDPIGTDAKAIREQMQRVDNDVNGNPRYVLHFLAFDEDYATAKEIANSLGWSVYRAKSHGGCFVGQAYCTKAEAHYIAKARARRAERAGGAA